ncbi:hypothetical protein DB41_JQ00110 [Neochlamydia sp. TUME1]|uniref:hypothetical protein n=1 Tax=Neochlamydia sp. TUME1 TaxID=1478174 RepID=UPI00057DD5D8|nr:hypothetical protein [Neochlamydia sp. TUME1]KIC73160.1 hypothetical protein DB41_JQ00110 [Neochlamydia sp. TUME1]
MRAILLSLLAAGGSASSNLFFRKNSQNSSASNPTTYLLAFYLTSFLFSFILYPTIFFESLNLKMLGIGALVGLLNIALMFFTSCALHKGPAGLTFAFQNTSAVFPGMILFALFGSENGFSYSYQKLLGILLVIGGLFLGAKGEAKGSLKSLYPWLKYALACLAVQVLALTFMQARCVICPTVETAAPSYALVSKEDVSFMLGQFGVACLIQAIYFLRQMNTWTTTTTMYGVLAGLANFASTALLLLATKWALPIEKGVLFPCFAVGTIIACNIWANRLYGEKFNYTSNAICAAGIILSLLA